MTSNAKNAILGFYIRYIFGMHRWILSKLLSQMHLGKHELNRFWGQKVKGQGCQAEVR